jgi:predicted nucleotidyltransferase
MISTHLHLAHDRLAEICRRYGVARLEVIGSFARGDTGPESDLDLVVTFQPDAHIGLELVALQLELEALTGRNVDLLTRDSIDHSPNKYFRHYALRRVEPLYEPS